MRSGGVKVILCPIFFWLFGLLFVSYLMLATFRVSTDILNCAFTYSWTTLFNLKSNILKVWTSAQFTVLPTLTSVWPEKSPKRRVRVGNRMNIVCLQCAPLIKVEWMTLHGVSFFSLTSWGAEFNYIGHLPYKQYNWYSSQSLESRKNLICQKVVNRVLIHSVKIGELENEGLGQGL